MTLWNRLQEELDKAGSAAKGALDEGKTRIELFRVRQLADKAAEKLGYAVYRARRDGVEVDADNLSALHGALAEQEEAANRLEAELNKLREDSAQASSEADKAKEDATEPPPPAA